MAGANPQTVRKQLLLINAVTWAPTYPAEHPLCNVFGWYRRHLQGVADLEFRCVHVESDPLEAVRNWADGVIISGSPRDAWSDDPVNANLLEVIRHCQDAGIPLLGVCYGHQLLGRFLGAKVGAHPQGLQLATVQMGLTAAGREHPLFHGMPRTFAAISGHADAVLDLPAGCELLASGGVTLTQSFHFENRLMGVQFHPEMDPEVLRFLWNVRKDAWQDRVTFDIPTRLAELRPTPDAHAVLRNFVEHFLVNGFESPCRL